MCCLAPDRGIFDRLQQLLQHLEFIPVFRIEAVFMVERIRTVIDVLVLIELEGVAHFRRPLNHLEVGVPSDTTINHDLLDMAVADLALLGLKVTTSSQSPFDMIHKIVASA